MAFWPKMALLPGSHRLIKEKREKIKHHQVDLSQICSNYAPEGPLKNHKDIRFLSNTGMDPMNNHKATKPAFNDGPLLVVFGTSLLSTK